MTVDTDVAPLSYSWQVKTASGTVLSNGTIVDTYEQFQMLRYKCDWRINLWLSGTPGETGHPLWGSIIGNPNNWWTPDYAGGVVWIKLVPESFLYFTDNPNQVYFAPAYMGLSSNVQWVGLKPDGSQTTNDGDIISHNDIIPKAQGETVGIYYQRGGGDNSTLTSGKLLSYQGTTLDPAIFRNEYWMRVNLLSFQVFNWWDYMVVHNYKFPSAFLQFTCYVFVVGTWTVYLKTGEVPVLTPHTPIMESANPFQGLIDWASNPYNQLWIVLIIGAVVVIVVSIASPGVWTVLAQSRKKT